MSQLIITIHSNIFLLIYKFYMEEFLRSTRHKKTLFVKEQHVTPTQLFTQCQSQLLRLNVKLKGFIANQRQRHLGTVLPAIENLGSAIKELKENINYEPTVDQQMKERRNLIGIKEKLLQKIKGYNTRMEQFKVKVQQLGIQNEELERQCKQNQQLLQGYQQEEQQDYTKQIDSLPLTPNRSSLHSMASMDTFKRSLPSVFGRQSRISREFLPSQNCQQKWVKVDRLLRKMATLNSDSLACSMLKEAKKEKNLLKSLLKNYQVSEKMGQLMKKSQVKQAWRQLSAILTC